jgi:hypothetical protein
VDFDLFKERYGLMAGWTDAGAAAQRRPHAQRRLEFGSRARPRPNVGVSTDTRAAGQRCQRPAMRKACSRETRTAHRESRPLISGTGPATTARRHGRMCRIWRLWREWRDWRDWRECLVDSRRLTWNLFFRCRRSQPSRARSSSALRSPSSSSASPAATACLKCGVHSSARRTHYDRPPLM